VFICGERVKGRTGLKWAIGVIAIVVLIGIGGVISLFVVGFISLEKGERHRRQFQAELDSDHRAHFQAAHKSIPTKFGSLSNWAEEHGVVQQTQ